MAEASLTPVTKRAKRIAPKVARPPSKPGPTPRGNRTKRDITVPPVYIDAMKKTAKKQGIGLFEWHRLALVSFVKWLTDTKEKTGKYPLEPKVAVCPHCGAVQRSTRGVGRHKRVRATVNFDPDCIDMMDWIAENFFLGTWSQAFQAAVEHYLGPDAPADDAPEKKLGRPKGSKNKAPTVPA